MESQLLDAYILLLTAAADDDDDSGVGCEMARTEEDERCPTEGIGPLITVGEFQDAFGHDDDDG